jgi:hypothetical protein
LVVAMICPAFASLGAQASALPDARVHVARHDSLVGGRAALEAHQSMHLMGTLTIAAAGIDAPLEILKRRPNQYVFRTVISQLGEMVRGFDGTNAWSVQPGQGPRLLSGAAAAAMAESADFFGDLHDLSKFASVETVEETDFFGVRAYKVRFTRPDGEVVHEFFNVSSGLSAGSSVEISTPVGRQESITVLAEYREFEGVRIASRIVQRQPEYESVIRIVVVEFDRLTAAALGPPPEVQALLDRAIVPVPDTTTTSPDRS